MVDTGQKGKHEDIVVYCDMVEIIDQNFRDSVEQLDKKILYLAAGTLGLSLSFVSDLVDLQTAQYVLVLIVSWFSLAGAIITNLFGYRFVTRLTHKQDTLDKLKRAMGIHTYDGVEVDPEELLKIADSHGASVENFNRWSFWLLIVGLVTMVAFVSSNVVRQLSSLASAA